MLASLSVTSIRSGGGLPTPLVVILVVAGVCYVMWRRLKGEPVQTRRLLVLPAVFTVLGVLDLTKSGAPHLSSADVAFLAAGAAISLGLGAARGATIELFPRGGYLYQRYRKTTVALWAVLIAAKLGLDLAAHLAGAGAAAGTDGLMLSLGVSLLGESALVAPRAMATGVPFAPDPKRNGGGRSAGSRLADDGSWHPRQATPTPQMRDDAPVSIPGQPAEPEAWASPSWRDVLGWVRAQLEQPPVSPSSPSRRRRPRR